MNMIESGNVAAALGVRLARAQVIAAYPITPQTPLAEKLAEYIEKGEMKAEYVAVESEHSALSVCIASSSTGARSFTATSANGLLYMSEQVHWCAGARVPMVMCVVNRGVGAPWTVWNDHQDAISQRDAGWIQIFVNDHQQIIDTVIKAYRLTEEVMIPVMVCYDGYYLSHTYMPFTPPEQALVDQFLPPYKYVYALDPKRPSSLNTVTLPDSRPGVDGIMAPSYMDIRFGLHQDLCHSQEAWTRIDQEYLALTGRGGHPLVEPYLCDDAEVIALAMGSLSTQLCDVADQLRQEGIKAGVVSLHMYRPFPNQAVAQVLGKAKKVVVFEKALSYGNQGALFGDAQGALYASPNRPQMEHHIVGLGGREIRTADLLQAFQTSIARQETPNQPNWIGLQVARQGATP